MGAALIRRRYLKWLRLNPFSTGWLEPNSSGMTKTERPFGAGLEDGGKGRGFDDQHKAGRGAE